MVSVLSSPQAPAISIASPHGPTQSSTCLLFDQCPEIFQTWSQRTSQSFPGYQYGEALNTRSVVNDRAKTVHAVREDARRALAPVRTEAARLASRRGLADLALFHDDAPPPSGGDPHDAGIEFLPRRVFPVARDATDVTAEPAPQPPPAGVVLIAPRGDQALAQARRDLEDTRFTAPYDLRLGEVEVEMHQFVGAGQRLFQADSLAAAEVEAHVPFAMMRRLLGGVTPAELPEDVLERAERLDLSGIRAEVALAGATDVGWAGRVVRVASGLDPATRTVRVVVRVDHPYREARPPDRPPLLRDMYTRVTLSAADTVPRLVVPAAAVHQGELYLADEDDRLERRPVEVAFEQHDLAVIAAGLAPGERVIVDDLQPAINGMALAPRRDAALERRLRALAAGERP